MFETSRLKLLPYKDIKAEDIFKYGADPEVSKFIGWPLFKTVEDAKKVYDTVLENVEKGTHFYYAMIDKETEDHIGSLMIFGVANGIGEVGYVLDQDYWGKGYGTEGVRWMVDYGFDEIGLHRIHAKVVATNIGSSRILEKLGFELEGTQREHFKVEDEYIDAKLYGMLSREYGK